MEHKRETHTQQQKNIYILDAQKQDELATMAHNARINDLSVMV